jgi:hypothetical protein
MYQTHHFKHEPVYRVGTKVDQTNVFIHDPNQYMLINIDAFILMASSVYTASAVHMHLDPTPCMMPQLERSSFDFFCTLDVFTICA